MEGIIGKFKYKSDTLVLSRKEIIITLRLKVKLFNCSSSFTNGLSSRGEFAWGQELSVACALNTSVLS